MKAIFRISEHQSTLHRTGLLWRGILSIFMFHVARGKSVLSVEHCWRNLLNGSNLITITVNPLLWHKFPSLRALRRLPSAMMPSPDVDWGGRNSPFSRHRCQQRSWVLPSCWYAVGATEVLFDWLTVERKNNRFVGSIREIKGTSRHAGYGT